MYCYRFQSQAQFRTLAAAEGLVTADDKLITAGHTFAIDEVGTITKGGKYDPVTGEVITPPKVLSGWHVNVVGDLAPEAWDQYLAVVNHPVRVFLGGPTQAPATPILEAMT
jgi:hypothetical protein